MSPELLSVICRTHSPDHLETLSEAVESVRAQTYRPIELLVVCQRFAPEDLAKAEQRLKHGWEGGERNLRLLNVTEPASGDLRGRLLNRGLEEANGRYLAFLDYDDVVLPEAYSLLIGALKKGDAVLAGGKIRQSMGHYASGRWVETSFFDDKFAGGRDRLDLLAHNFLPIHAYVLDRTRIRSEHLKFPEDYPVLEDYRFLLTLAAQYRMDFSNIDRIIGEYRFRTDQSNTTLGNEERNSEKARIWDEGLRRLRADTNGLPFVSTIGEIIELMEARRRGAGLSPHGENLANKFRKAIRAFERTGAGRAAIQAFSRGSNLLRKGLP